MRIIKLIRENVGWKIAVVTSVALLFVAVLMIGSFSVIPVQLFSKFNLIQILVVLVLILTLLAVLVINIATSTFIQKPIDRLTHAISLAQAGNLKSKTPVNSVDEIGELSDQFNQMLYTMSELDARKIQTERELIQVQEELKYKKVLEEKSFIIEKTNQQLEKTVKELSVLYEVSQMISSTLEPDELYNIMLDVVKTLGFNEFALLVFDDESQKLSVKTAYGFQDNEKVKEMIFDLGEGISGLAAQRRQPIYIKDTSREETYLHYKGEKQEEGSFFSIPLISHERLMGVMNFTRPGVDSFSTNEIRLLNSLANQIAIAMENTRLYAKTKELSVTDELTHIYNRRHFQNMLEMEWRRAKRFSRNVSLLMIDVDHFKNYNDSYGHLEGDQVLKGIAAILGEHVREVDTVARYGGEEFSIILTHTDANDALQVALKLCKMVAAHSFRNEERNIDTPVTVSIGVATYPNDALNMEDLINHADIALYKAKNQGRNRVVTYQQAMSSGLRVV